MSRADFFPDFFRGQTIRQIRLLLGVALVPALLAALLHPKRPEWGWTPPAVSWLAPEEAGRLARPVIWVDARAEAAYRAGHVPGAVSLDAAQWEEKLPGFIAALRPDARVVVYCDGRNCDAAETVALRLRHELRLENVFVLKGGWSAWQQTQKK